MEFFLNNQLSLNTLWETLDSLKPNVLVDIECFLKETGQFHVIEA